VSFQNKERYGWMVVCDLCGCFGAIFDRDWREMRKDSSGEPAHLCRRCRRDAVWCEVHKQYHRPEDNHRRACVMCGGLFTARVNQRINRCPSCLRAGRLAVGAHS
jgi:hypothetical protein